MSTGQWLLSLVAAFFLGSASAYAQDLVVDTNDETSDAARQTAGLVLGTYAGALRGCLQGTGSIELSLHPDGRVKRVHESSDSEQSCILRVLRDVRLSPTLGTRITIRLPVPRGVLAALSANGNARIAGSGISGTTIDAVLGGLQPGTVGGQEGVLARGTAMRATMGSAMAGRPVIRGSLSRAEIQRVIRSNNNVVRYCYERELQRTPGLRGRVRLRFTISPDGSVQSASTADVEAPMQRVADCLVRRVRRWRFPAPRGGGIVVVTYPFVFRPS